MSSLKINVGAVDLERGVGPSLPIPPIVLDMAISRFQQILDDVSDWCLPSNNPIAIPDKPNSAYYKEFALAFARSYFTKNLFKCVLTLEIVRHHIKEGSEFYDLGGGSGAFSIALALSGKAKRVNLIDRSPTQVKLAEIISKRMGLGDIIEAKISNFSDFSSVKKICTSSYSLSEAMQDDVNILRIIEDSELFIAIDSPAIIKGIYSYLKFREFHVFGRQVEFELGDNLAPYVEGGAGKFSFILKTNAKKME